MPSKYAFFGTCAAMLLASATVRAAGASQKRADELAVTIAVIVGTHFLLPEFWKYRRYWLVLTLIAAAHLALLWLLFDKIWPDARHGIFAIVVPELPGAIALCMWLRFWIEKGDGVSSCDANRT